MQTFGPVLFLGLTRERPLDQQSDTLSGRRTKGESVHVFLGGPKTMMIIANIYEVLIMRWLSIFMHYLNESFQQA